MTLIKSDRQLQDFLENFDPEIHLALDTEFVREKTYYPTLCLVQIGAKDQAVCADCIDGVSSETLSNLMAGNRTLLFHAGRQDLEILWYATGLMPHRLLDTQVAAALTGFPSQIGYADLAFQLLGVELDKSQSRRDWTQRPLPADAIRYALDDVVYLEPLLNELSERLERMGRLNWLYEDCAAQLDPSQFQDLEKIGKRLKGVGRLSSDQRQRAAKLVSWREDRAQKLNRPRRWILADDALVAIARIAPKSVETLNQIEKVPNKLIERNGEHILAALQGEAAFSVDAPAAPSKEQRALQKELQASTMGLAKEIGVEPEVLATRQELSAIAFGNVPDRLAKGWRSTVLRDAQLI